MSNFIYVLAADALLPGVRSDKDIFHIGEKMHTVSYRGWLDGWIVKDEKV